MTKRARRARCDAPMCASPYQLVVIVQFTIVHSWIRERDSRAGLSSCQSVFMNGDPLSASRPSSVSVREIPLGDGAGVSEPGRELGRLK